MGRRGRRQVLQLDDSGSHQSRRYGYQGQQNEEKSLPASNPLLNLMGQYNSDDDENSDEEGQEDSKQEEVTDQAHESQLSYVSVVQKQPDDVAKTEGSNIDLEVASFLAEIESISADLKQPVTNKEEMLSAQGDPSSTLFSEQRAPDYGYILKSEANVDREGEAQKKPRQSSSTAYKSMFVKGEPEFVKQEDMHAQKDAKVEDKEELPEEPLSKWQMVQDETTQYYYYWNTESNEVTWEIPPDYTQYLLLYKEYEEKLAAIPESRLKVLTERREKKRLVKESQHQSMEAASANGHPVLGSLEHPPAPVDEQRSQKTSRHKKQSHHYKDQNEDLESTPHSPLALSNTVGKNSEGKHAVEKHSVVHGSSMEGTDLSTTDSSTAVCHETSMAFLSESIEPLSDYTEDVATVKTKEIISLETPGFAAVSEEPKDISFSVTVEANKIDLDENHLANAGPPAQPDLISVPVDEVLNAEQVGGSKITRPDPGCEKEKALASKSPNAVDEDDDDFDMDFDDIDDLDRALEKALEKKLEKKKAELQKLELEQPAEPAQTETYPLALSPLVTQNPDSRDIPQEPQSVAAETDAEIAAKPDVTAEAAGASSPPEAALETSDVIQIASKRKAEEGRMEEARENTKPAEKKARLVAYDAYESDEDDEEEKDEQMPEVKDSPAFPILTKEEAEVGVISALPTPPPETPDNQADIQEKVETALAKLSFLGVTETELSRLQVIAVQLQTRLKDWQEGGLNGEYFFQRVSEVNATLQQYENGAVPPGWACHWDRSFRRYFYTNTSSGESQWDYPEQGAGSGPGTPQAAATELLLARGEKDVVAKPKSDPDGAKVQTSGDAGGEEEDLDGVAMSDGDNETGEGDISSTKTSCASKPTDVGSKALSLLPSFFPGEPLPPGTELLFGLPPPPPPPLPSDGFSAMEDDYVCHDDSSSDSSVCQDHMGESISVLNGNEVKSEESTRDEASALVEDAAEVKEDQSVISKPPQLRFHATAPSSVSSIGAFVASSSTSLASDSEVVNVSSSLAQSYSEPRDGCGEPSESATCAKSWIGPECPHSPSMEESPRAVGSPGPIAGDGVGQEKHRKKKKEKLGSSGLSLKKKGVSSLVQKWQKVKREVEQEERANERRQMAIRQQLDEWKKENS